MAVSYCDDAGRNSDPAGTPSPPPAGMSYQQSEVIEISSDIDEEVLSQPENFLLIPPVNQPRRPQTARKSTAPYDFYQRNNNTISNIQRRLDQLINITQILIFLIFNFYFFHLLN